MTLEPFAHNHGQTLFYFSLNTWIDSEEVLRWMLAIWAGLHTLILYFVAIQFINRHLCLLNANFAAKLEGIYGYCLMSIPLIPGPTFALSIKIVSRETVFDNEMRYEAQELDFKNKKTFQKSNV